MGYYFYKVAKNKKEVDRIKERLEKHGYSVKTKEVYKIYTRKERK
jgi:N-acetyl-anhydromuramyl-L-alanine amidase AmpD